MKLEGKGRGQTAEGFEFFSKCEGKPIAGLW